MKEPLFLNSWKQKSQNRQKVKIRLLSSKPSICHFTPLHYASLNDSVDMVGKLLAGGADHTKVGKTNLTALCLASINGHANTVKVLLQHGAKIYEGTAPNPISLASKIGHHEVALILQRHSVRKYKKAKKIIRHYQSLDRLRDQERAEDVCR